MRVAPGPEDAERADSILKSSWQEHKDSWYNFLAVMLRKPTTCLTTTAGILSLVQATLAAANITRWASLGLGLAAGIFGLLATSFAHDIQKENQALQSSNHALEKRDKMNYTKLQQKLKDKVLHPSKKRTASRATRLVEAQVSTVATGGEDEVAAVATGTEHEVAAVATGTEDEVGTVAAVSLEEQAEIRLLLELLGTYLAPG